MRARTKSLLACLIGIALAVPALAQTGGVTQYPACPDPPPKLSQTELEAAHASYKVGVEAYDKGDYPKALDNFRDAFRRDCSKVALLNFISRAYEGKGDKPEAIHALEVYLQRNPKAEDAEAIQTRIQNLKAQLGQGTATATAATTTATSTATTTATVTPTATSTASATATEQPSGGHTVAPWIVVGAGGVAAIAGGIFLGLGQGEVSHSRQGCTSNPDGSLACTPLVTTPDGQDRKTLNSRGTTLSNVGLVVGGVGLAAVIGGLVWHFIEPTKAKAAAFAPVIGPGYAGLAFGSQF
jgi:tetratricopeptide (TPR) repeat protein